MERWYRLAAALITMGAFAGGVAHGEPVFRAGTAMVDVTPQTFPIRTAGNLNLTLADRVLDPLYVRAIVLDDGSITTAIAVIDSCMVDREMLYAAKAIAERETGIPASRMLISSTHTHSAPAAFSFDSSAV